MKSYNEWVQLNEGEAIEDTVDAYLTAARNSLLDQIHKLDMMRMDDEETRRTIQSIKRDIYTAKENIATAAQIYHREQIRSSV